MLYWAHKLEKRKESQVLHFKINKKKKGTSAKWMYRSVALIWMPTHLAFICRCYILRVEPSTSKLTEPHESTLHWSTAFFEMGPPTKECYLQTEKQKLPTVVWHNKQ